MKIFSSAIETSGSKNKPPLAVQIIEQGYPLRWVLMSYFYIRKNKKLAVYVRDHAEEVLIDSGAHTFQKGTHVDWDKYTEEYANWIKWYDRPNVIGYFEMDADNIIGYEKVRELRERLEKVSDKIIPVWHTNRGIDEFKNMCKEYSGKIVSVTGFKNMEIKDEQYMLFVKEARKNNCKIHCLGMTRKNVLDKVPFDYTDSSSWLQESVYGRIQRKQVDHQYQKSNQDVVKIANYKRWLTIQDSYYKKWRMVCKD